MLTTPNRSNRLRTIALLLSGVLPLAIQPSALAGQIAASRNVDRMVSDLPNPITIEDLVRLLGHATEADQESSDSAVLPGDVAAMIVQCKLLSLMSDTVALQAPDLDVGPAAGVATVERLSAAKLPVLTQDCSELPDVSRPVRRLSDEQPLGP